MEKQGEWDTINRFFEWIAVWFLVLVLTAVSELVSPLPMPITILTALYFSLKAVDKGYGAPAVVGLTFFTFSWQFSLKYNENTGWCIWGLGVITWLVAVLASYNAHKKVAELLRAKYKPAGGF
jgi:hypothetical protein